MENDTEHSSILLQNFDMTSITKEVICLSPPLKLKNHSESSSSQPAFLLRNCLTREECKGLINLAENKKKGLFTQTLVNIEGEDVINKDVRSGSRYILDSVITSLIIISTIWEKFQISRKLCKDS